ncbi:ABC transporter substrate-binding protein [Streptomyces sp. NPDC020597]|uniref:ABC transporter substrate-binding protein n=1 Tax=unclassified Streptomyces TaxID=2593676 RepID=UPI0037A226B5
MTDGRVDRRAFLRGVGGIAAGVAATPLTACETRTDQNTSRTKNPKLLVVRDSGGTYGQANRKAIYDPFTEETGIQINVVNILHPQMLTQMKAGRPMFDAMDIDMLLLMYFQQQGASEELDYDRLKNAENSGIAKSLLASHGVGKNYWASVLAYRTDAFAGKGPETWAEFWDTRAFPGGRALQSSMDYPELEFALIADGVPLDKLYPLDVDRAFKALNEIKDSVRTFWDSGAAPGELLERNEVVASSAWNGRLGDPIQRGVPLACAWNGARRQCSGYGIPKGAANPDAAYRLIDFALRPEVQAGFARIYPSGPVVPAAYGHLSEATATNLPSTPGHLLSGFDLNIEWWLQNRNSVAKRWQEWVRA